MVGKVKKMLHTQHDLYTKDKQINKKINIIVLTIIIIIKNCVN